MTTQTTNVGAGMEASDRVALLVAAQVQAGMLEHSYWADLIRKAAKVEQAIGAIVKRPDLSLADLDQIIGDRKR